MWKIRRFEVRPGHRIWVEFADGVAGEADLTSELWGPLGEPLRDPDVFAAAFLDEFGAIAWPNGFDLAPDALHEELAADAAGTRSTRSSR